ncbi:DUF5348 domain-containing protein (plasmid) [Sutcliffiella horikoshii]|uniref:DUF5348 domain-containing protein n=1 Tax=Sutcliffiella horikoshii TaxID=79883 RepID=UPI001CBFBB5A|nr:DUF5348 domain-containing protein [Sutcliffiella horikoshii]UAL49830.1 DUF5348 domain-containing protein [Sutcliffiella horikoshii]
MTYFNKSSMKITLEEETKEFNILQGGIQKLLYKLGDDAENIESDSNDLDSEFLQSEYRSMFDKLEDVYYRLEYLKKPVIDEGLLTKNIRDRYELPSGLEFSSGYPCEILYFNPSYNEEYWVYTSIEHNGEDYYATALGRELSINGLRVRVRK